MPVRLVAFAAGAASVDVAAAFRAAAEDLQRPVDLLGLLEIALDLGTSETSEVAVVDPVRPARPGDGSPSAVWWRRRIVVDCAPASPRCPLNTVARSPHGH